MLRHEPPTQNEMNKKHLVSVAALAALFCLPCAVPMSLERTVILASTDPSADQFIDQYCGTYITGTDGLRQFAWYTQVNNTNAPILLESFTVFGQLAPSTQQTIVATCLAHNMDYYSAIGQAQALLTSPSTPQQALLEQGGSTLEPEAENPSLDISQNSSNQSDTLDVPSAPIAEVPTSSGQENKTSSEKNDSAPSSSESKDTPSSTVSEEPLPAPIATTQDPLANENQEPSNRLEEPTIVSNESEIPVENNELGSLSSEENQVSLPLDATDIQTSEAVPVGGGGTSSNSTSNLVNNQGSIQDGQATQFLNRYCYQNGTLIRQANQSNYRQLLNAVGDWLALSEGTKEAVNGFLISMGSQTFQTLYTQANRIRLGLPLTQVPAGSQSSVNTAAWQDPSIWVSGMWLSGQGMLYLTNERRLKVRIKKVKA